MSGQKFHVYRPSGYVGTMTLEEGRQYAQHDPQALIESADKPSSQQAVYACEAAQKREELHQRHEVRHSGVLWWLFMVFLALYTLALRVGW